MQHRLTSLFHPKGIAVVGASDRHGSFGRKVFSQLWADHAAPTIVPVNPSHKMVGGQKAYESLTDAQQEHRLDTAVVILSPDKLAGIVREAGKTAIRQVIFVSEIDAPNHAVRQKLERAAALARKADIQLLAMPAGGLRGVFAVPQKAACTYIGQSSDIADCMTHYAQERGIEFSRFITLHPQDYPVSTGQIIDFVAAEDTTTSLLVHVSVLDNVRELVSALAYAARYKPVIVLTTLPDAAQEALFTQALERVHVLSVHTLTQFSTAAKLVHTGITSRGNRLHIISNSPQISALSCRVLDNTPLVLSGRSAGCLRQLGKLLPYKPERYNPLDVPIDTSPSVFQSLVESSLHDEESDAVLVIYAGQHSNDCLQTAQLISQLQAKSGKPLLLTWLGSADTDSVRDQFNCQKNLHFKQPEHAIQALAQLDIYRNRQQNRYALQPFHDYRYAVAAAEELQKSLRPMIPVAVLSAGKSHITHLLNTLRLHNLTAEAQKQPALLHLQSERDPVFGQLIHLYNESGRQTLLPPLLPTEAQRALQALGLDSDTWLNCLLDTAETVCRLPEVHSLTLALTISGKGIACTEAKLHLQDTPYPPAPNVVAPPPALPTEQFTLANGQIVRLRPVRPEDASLLQTLYQGMDDHSRYLRFMIASPELPPSLIARLSHPDYQREFALLLHDDQHRPLAHAHYSTDANGQSGEFGIGITPSLQGQGVGGFLMQQLLQQAQKQGLQQMRAEILAENHPMQRLALKLGFTLSKHPEDTQLLEARLDLNNHS